LTPRFEVEGGGGVDCTAVCDATVRVDPDSCRSWVCVAEVSVESAGAGPEVAAGWVAVDGPAMSEANKVAS
jgi:hypothetical protein